MGKLFREFYGVVANNSIMYLFFLNGKHLLEMATHSSVLAWRITWMEMPGRLQSIGSHRVGHD